MMEMRFFTAPTLCLRLKIRKKISCRRSSKRVIENNGSNGLDGLTQTGTAFSGSQPPEREKGGYK
jgi:hypothetical protein